MLTAEDVAAFRGAPRLRDRMIDALRVMLGFYGLELRAGEPPQIVRRPSFNVTAARWVTRGNHNFLRLTRMLRSLRTAGLEPYACALRDALEAIHRERAPSIGNVPLQYWRDAMTDPKLLSGSS